MTSQITQTYDSGNIFAKILRGEIPAHKVYETEDVLAFMDIMPRGDGHTLVISKIPSRTILDIPSDALAKLILAVQHVAAGVKSALAADGITIQQFNESAGGQVVFHLHFHIIPRYEGVKMRPHTSEMAPPEQLRAYAEKIRLRLV
jgi:histidine triad (HIT) family protein